MTTQQDIEQQAALFRRMTGGIPATVYIRKAADGFEVKVRLANGQSPQGLVDNLVNAVGGVCSNLGMTVKI